MSTVFVRSATGGAEKAGHPYWLKIGFWACIVIAIAVVLRRVVAFVHPQQSGPPQMVQLDTAFASHAGLTLAHILPAMAFVVLTPIVLLRWSKAAWLEQVLFFLGLVVGITAYGMSAYAVGGWIERSAVLFFNSLLFVLVSTRFLAYASWCPASGEAVAGSCDRNIAWNCHDSSCDGGILRYQPSDAP